MNSLANNKYEVLFKASGDAMLIIDGDKFVDCNQASLDMLGYEKHEDLLSAHPSELSPKFQADGQPSFDKANELISIAKEQGGNRFEWIHTHANGESLPVEVLLTYIPFEGRDLLHVVWRNITKRKQAEEVLQKAHDELELRVTERTRALTEEVHERRTIEAELLDRTELQQLLYAITSIANKADDTNAAMKACLKNICNYTSWPVGHIYAVSPTNPEQLIPTDIWHMEHPQWHAVFRDITMRTTFKNNEGLPGRVLASGKPAWVENVTIDDNFPRAKQGQDIRVKAAFCFPIKVRNKVVAVMEFFSPFDQKADQPLMQSIEHIGTQLGHLQERAEVERSLLEAKKEAETANKAKSDFLSSMSHELRTPLNAIIGFSSIMKDEAFGPIENDKYLEYQNDIHHSGLHLLKLINDVLDVSAIEAGALELQEENVNLTDIADAAVNLIGPRADGGQVSVSCSIDPEIPLIYADGRRLEQIILNLLSNAVKFTPQGGEVSLTARLNDNGSLAVAVSDTGIGMDDEEVKIAFNRFGQVDSGLDRKHEGTGLGLPLTKVLVELHDGILDVKSEKGRGTLFTVTFPKERVLKSV